MTESQTQSQWERVGGEPAVKAVLDRFYEGVLDEPQLSGFFENVAVDDIKPHLAEVLKVVLGGPGANTEIDLAGYLTEAHSGLGVSESDFELTGKVLLDTLEEFEVPADIVETIEGVLATVQPFVVAA
ncbi:hemoglobin [Catenulispora sp. MAP12-49]|jgi:hemoglobin|uniref:group I truncated hemoglobin n=1 Tax=unclassified Catenulispora TaxID=414885 RepID=UPI0035131719